MYVIKDLVPVSWWSNIYIVVKLVTCEHIIHVYALFVLGFYVIATIFQSYNGGQLSWPYCFWTGLAFLSGEPVLSAHTFTRNWHLPFLNQQQVENDHRNYYMINLHESVAGPGLRPATPWFTVRLALPIIVHFNSELLKGLNYLIQFFLLGKLISLRK